MKEHRKGWGASPEKGKFVRFVGAGQVEGGHVIIHSRYPTGNPDKTITVLYADREIAENALPSLEPEERDAVQSAVYKLHYAVEKTPALTLNGFEAYALSKLFINWAYVQYEPKIGFGDFAASAIPPLAGTSPSILIAWRDPKGAYHFHLIRSTEEAKETLGQLEWVRGKKKENLIRELQSHALPNRSGIPRTIAEGRIAEAMAKALFIDQMRSSQKQ